MSNKSINKAFDFQSSPDDEKRCKQWFESRGLKILDYQVKILTNDIQQVYYNNQPTVLAAAPSSGKSIMAIYFLDEYLQRNPNARVLILTHGQDILRSQFYSEIIDIHKNIKPSFSFSVLKKYDNLVANRSQVIITLPQTIHGYFLPHFDLLIVDEAHDYYFPNYSKTNLEKIGMVQKIIKQINPDHQLLLTGTPSDFVLKKYPIIPISLNTLMEYDMVADTYVEVATSTYSFKTKDYNKKDDLKNRFKIKNEETISTLDLLLTKIIKRLNSFELALAPSNWETSLRVMEKTMIACKNQDQARQVYEYFISKSVDVALSITDENKGDSEIQRFIKESQCLVLIVVARGVLGFNYPKMRCVIDMTASQNINRIFQLLCRAIRPYGNHKKFFFKVVPYQLDHFFEFIMTCVHCLQDDEYYLKFNGTNFYDLKIPILKEISINPDKKQIGNDEESKNNIPHIKSIYSIGLPNLRFWKDILHSNHNVFSPYIWTTLTDVKHIIFSDKKFRYWTEERCVESAKPFSIRGDWQKEYSGAYDAARRLGIVDKCCAHMETLHIKWTEEKLIESAKPFSNRVDWQRTCRNAYSTAHKWKILDKCCAHMKTPIRWTPEKCIENAKLFSIRADWQKLQPGAYHAARRFGIFAKCCAHMKAKVHQKWAEKELIESAKPFSKKSYWKKEYPSAYSAALKMGILNKCCAHMKIKIHQKWTEEKLLESAKPFFTMTSWQKRCSEAHYAAKKMGMLEKCCKHMYVRTNWTEDKLLEIAKLFSKRVDWQKECHGAYQAAKKMGILDKCCSHMKVFRINWTEKELLESAKPFTRRANWQKECSGAYQAAKKMGILDKCCAHMPIKNNWTEEKCIKSAKPFSYKKLWQKAHGGAYNAACKMGILNECCSHMISGLSIPRKWTEEKLIECAQQFKTKPEFRHGNYGAYQAAKKIGIMEECCKHMAVTFKWTEEKCVKSAKPFNNKSQWKKVNGGAYAAATRMEILDKCCKHMTGLLNIWNEEKCVESAKSFNNKKPWSLACPGAYNYAIKNNILDKCCKHMMSSKK